MRFPHGEEGRVDLRLGTRILLLQLAVVVLTLRIAFDLFAFRK
jgi:hypothetical protein